MAGSASAIRARPAVAIGLAAILVLSGLSVVAWITLPGPGSEFSAPVSLPPTLPPGSNITVAPALAVNATAGEIGPLAGASPMEVLVGLALRDPSGFEGRLAAEYVPGTPLYHQWIDPSVFASEYGPSATTLTSATSYFSNYGLKVTTSPDHLFLLVRGSADQVAGAFHTSFDEYHSASGREFFSHSTPAVLPAIAPWSGVLGLGNETPLLPLAGPITSNTPIAGPAASCSGSTEYLVPCQLWNAYNISGFISSGTNGSGLRIGIVDTYDGDEPQSQLERDLAAFDSAMSLPAASVDYNDPIPTTLNLNATSNVWGLEEALDLEWNHASAPGATIEMTFSPDSGPGLYAGIDWLVSQEKIDVLSLSWGEPDVGIYNSFSGPCPSACNATTDGSYAVLSPVLALAAAEGISVFAASGDCGAADGTNGVSTNYPSSDLSVTGVGGTVLSVTATGGYVSEVGWSGNLSGAVSPGCDNRGGSGGGFAPTPRPWWQTGPGLPTSPDQRGVPDVAMDAGTPVEVEVAGTLELVGGTSLGTPIWAGIAAIADQYSGHVVGDLAPTLYRILSGPDYTTDFHEIVSGNNGYSAGPDWNAVTGIGTPNASALIPALTGFSEAQSSLRSFLYATPTEGAAPLTVSFGITASGGSGAYPFQGVYFGDGNASLAPNGSASHTYPTPGVYSAISYVVDSTGNLTISEPVAILVGGGQNFSVSLSASDTTPAAGDAVTLTAVATGGTAPYAYDWSFGDGAYLNWTSDASVNYTYFTPGAYCPVVIAEDSAVPIGGATSAPVAITVGGASPVSCTQTLSPLTVTPTAEHSVRDAPADFPDLFQISGGPTPWDPSSVEETFASSDPYVSACGCAILRSPGNYTITIVATDPEDQRASGATNVTVAPALSAKFTAGATHGVVPFTVPFSASVSGGLDANVSDTVWTSGTGLTAVGATASFLYTKPGIYLATGHVSDSGDGNASEAFLIDALSSEGPSISATVTPAVDVAVGATVSAAATAYAANGTPASPATFLWDLGNGSSAYGPDVQWTYEGSNTSGTVAWNGSLSAEGVPGLSDAPIPLSISDFGALEAGDFIPRVDALDLAATGGPLRGSATLVWRGTASAAGPGGASVSWATSNGLLENGRSADFEFTTPGTYDANATATDPFSDQAVEPHAVTVYTPLTFTGGPSERTGRAPLTVEFTAAGAGGTGGPYGYLWILGNLSESTAADTNYTFSSPGSYFVELLLSDSAGTVTFGNWTIVVLSSPSSSSSATIGGVPLGLVLLAVAAGIGVIAGVLALDRRRPGPPPTP